MLVSRSDNSAVAVLFDLGLLVSLLLGTLAAVFFLLNALLPEHPECRGDAVRGIYTGYHTDDERESEAHDRGYTADRADNGLFALFRAGGFFRDRAVRRKAVAGCLDSVRFALRAAAAALRDRYGE